MFKGVYILLVDLRIQSKLLLGAISFYPIINFVDTVPTGTVSLIEVFTGGAPKKWFLRVISYLYVIMGQ